MLHHLLCSVSRGRVVYAGSWGDWCDLTNSAVRRQGSEHQTSMYDAVYRGVRSPRIGPTQQRLDEYEAFDRDVVLHS
jgi:hypothetical protein